MAYAVIELRTLNLALNPLFCKTDVMRSPFFPSSFIRFVVRWLGSSFAFLFGFVRLEKCKCATKCVEFLKQV